LLDQPGDPGALAAVDADLDPRVVPDGDEAALHRADRAAGEFADEDVTVVDVGAGHLAGGLDQPFRDEVAQHADDRGEVRVHEPVADVDDRGPVALQRGHPDRAVVGPLPAAQRGPRVEPLRVLLVGVVDERGAQVAPGDQVLQVADGRAVPEREADLRLQPLGPGQLRDLPDVAVVVRDRLLAQHVLAGLDGRAVDGEVIAVAGDHVDDVDVAAVEQLAVVGGGDLGAVALGRGGGPLGLAVADTDDLAPLVPGPAGQVRQPRPAARADHAYAESL